MDAIESAVAITAALVTPLASEPSPAAMAEAAKPSSSSRAKLCFVDLRPQQSRPKLEWVPYVKPATSSLRADASLPCPKRASNLKASSAGGTRLSYLSSARGSLNNA
jgi:hypothetical protein